MCMLQTEIKAALEKVCSILPETVRNQCTSFVDTYSAAIIALLAQELDPQQICTALGLCSSSSTLKGESGHRGGGGAVGQPGTVIRVHLSGCSGRSGGS